MASRSMIVGWRQSMLLLCGLVAGGPILVASASGAAKGTAGWEDDQIWRAFA